MDDARQKRKRPASSRLARHPFGPCGAALTLLVGSLAIGAAAAHAAGQAKAPIAGLSALERAAGGSLNFTTSTLTGIPTFLGTARGKGVPIAAPGSAKAAERARSFLRSYGRSLGWPDSDQVTVLSTSGPDEVGMEHVRLQQLHRGIPVSSAQLTVHLRGSSLIAVHARTMPDAEVDVVPTLTAEEALSRADDLARREYGAANAKLGKARLEVFSPELLEGDARAPARLAWVVEASGPDLDALVWVDAENGEVLHHVNRISYALFRRVHDPSEDDPTLPGFLRRVEGDPPTGDADVDDCYDFAGDTYDYFFTAHGRDSYDGAGAMMVVVANYPYSPISSWRGSFVLSADVFVTDDIIAHEFTHGFVQYTAGLSTWPATQAASLNESYADIFGETIDLLNGRGDDSPAVRWALFEDFLGPAGLRHMMNPNDAATPGPGRMGDPQFICDADAPHQNGGVPNHAYALTVDGGEYNNRTIDGIGLTKAAKIEYRSLSVYLTPTSTFRDKYDALRQSCLDLIGASGITVDDCAEATKALNAVEMYFPWPCNCGNGVLDELEECDDGNQIDGDGCDSNCLTTRCGNGIVTAPEQCDGGDCCLANCQSIDEAACNPAPLTDHFKCYRTKDLKQPKFAGTTVSLVDQLGVNDGQFEVKNPFVLCNPVDKNGEGISDTETHLVCHKIKGPVLDKSDRPHLEVVNQFGFLQLEVKKPFLLCVPSVKTVLP